MDISNKASEAAASLAAYNTKKAELADLSAALTQCTEWIAVEAKTTELETAKTEVESLATELRNSVNGFLQDVSSIGNAPRPITDEDTEGTEPDTNSVTG